VRCLGSLTWHIYLCSYHESCPLDERALSPVHQCISKNIPWNMLKLLTATFIVVLCNHSSHLGFTLLAKLCERANTCKGLLYYLSLQHNLLLLVRTLCVNCSSAQIICVHTLPGWVHQIAVHEHRSKTI